MTYGSLFSGIGGLDLGIEMATGARPVWFAESDPYARAVLAKHWPDIRIYEDVKDVDENATHPDILCGGFPCQDISNAGNRAGIDGERSGLWSEYARIIRALRPRIVFVENVAALVNRGLDRVLGDLAACGYDAEWSVLRASDVGAPHQRRRVFILANASGTRSGGLSESGRWIENRNTDGTSAGMADTKGICEREPSDETNAVAVIRQTRNESSHSGGGNVGHTEGIGRVQGGAEFEGRIGEPASVGASSSMGDTDSERREEQRSAVAVGPQFTSAQCAGHRFPPGPDRIATHWDGPKPAIRRGIDGVPRRMDRLRCLGNSVVPQQAALAFRELYARAFA